MTRPRPVRIRAGLPVTLCLLAALGLFAGCAAKAVEPPPGATAASQSRPTTGTAKASSIIRTARLMIGAPYRWGGESPQTGFDCSGLVWFAYRQHGVSLPRVSWQQFGVGQPVQRSALKPGDLVFHKIDKTGKTLHVGIVTDRGTFVHAPSSGKHVMESNLNNAYWRKHFVGARRVL